MSNTASVTGRGLAVRNLVNTGGYSALVLVVTLFVARLFASSPTLVFLVPPTVALLAGPAYLSLVAKVPRHGPILLLGGLLGLSGFVTGMQWPWTAGYCLLAVVAEWISGRGKFRDSQLNSLGYMVFSLSPIGSYIMLWIDRQAYWDHLVGKGVEPAYLDTMSATAQGWMLPSIIVATLLFARVSASLGRRLLKKR